ncbi:MAG: hypothetical protein ACK4TK_10450 [Thiobacillaceae bacterium]
MHRYLIILIAVGALGGCDRLYERAGLPDPAKQLAEGKAIGGACRHAGRGLEDCYALNPAASKAAIYEGWKEMNEYMAKNGMQAIPPQIDPATRKPSARKTEAAEADPGADPEAKPDGGKPKAASTSKEGKFADDKI